MNFQVRQLSDSEISSLESEFISLSPRQKEYREAWLTMHDFFSQATPVEARSYWKSFFRWYVEMSWKLINELVPEDVIEMFKQQVPVALLLGTDVWMKLMRYLQFKPFDDASLASFYGDVRQSFLESDYYIGTSKGESISVKQLVAEVKKINAPNVSSLEVAESNAKINSILYSKEVAEITSFNADPLVTVDRFIGLTNFFLGVKPEKIWAILAGFERSTLVKEDDSKDINKSVGLSDIKKIVENKFPKKPDGQFADPTEAVTMLNDLAERYNDERIRELYIFNEKTGAFEWNDADRKS